MQFADLQQVPDDARAWQHDDVAALLLAQLPDSGGRVGRDDARIVAVGLLQGGREDDLLDRAEPLREGRSLRSACSSSTTAGQNEPKPW